MDGLNSSVITGKCSGCTAYRKELREAREMLAAVEEELARHRVSSLAQELIERLDRILKGGD